MDGYEGQSPLSMTAIQRSGGKMIIAACMMMLAVEAWIFLFQSDDWDLQGYQNYARQCRETSWRSLYANYTVEYPPLGVLLMVATDAVAQHLPDCSRIGRFFDTYDCPEAFANFKFMYRLEMAGVVFLAFLLLCRELKHCMPEESAGQQCERLAVFCIGIAILSPIAFDRLDGMLGALLLAALALMTGRRHYGWSFAVLAVAIGFKFVPVVLGPLWVIGALPAGLVAKRKSRGGWARLAKAVAVRAGVLVALVAALCAPFLMAAGFRCLAFVSYHKDRGIEYESSYATLLSVLKYVSGVKTGAHLNFGSFDVESSLSPALVHIAPVVAGSALVATALLLVVNVARAAGELSRRGVPATERLGRAWCKGFVAHTMLVMFVFVSVNKVFSPQYLMWLLALAPLVPLKPWPRRLFHAGFIGICALTSLIYPYCTDETLGKALPTDSETFSGPSPFGVTLFSLRIMFLISLIAGLVAHLMHSKPMPTVPGYCAREGDV
jgi:hypothetical protein